MRLSSVCGLLGDRAKQSDPAEQLLRSIKPHGTTFEYKYLGKFETELKNNLGCEFGDHKGRFMEKTRSKKSRATVPLSEYNHQYHQCHLFIKIYSMIT